MTKLKAKALISLFERDDHGFKFLSDFAETIEWATDEIITAALGFTYD